MTRVERKCAPQNLIKTRVSQKGAVEHVGRACVPMYVQKYSGCTLAVCFCQEYTVRLGSGGVFKLHFVFLKMGYILHLPTLQRSGRCIVHIYFHSFFPCAPKRFIPMRIDFPQVRRLYPHVFAPPYGNRNLRVFILLYRNMHVVLESTSGCGRRKACVSGTYCDLCGLRYFCVAAAPR